MPNPACYAPGPPSIDVGGDSDTAPNCDELLEIEITSYLAARHSPLTGTTSALVRAGEEFNVDPRFIAALAGAETSFGKNITWGPFNAWNNSGHRPPKPAYSSWADAGRDATRLIRSGYLDNGYTDTESIYKRYEGTTNYAIGLNNLNRHLRKMGGNPAELDYPCPERR
jgi:hypothetical protein